MTFEAMTQNGLISTGEIYWTLVVLVFLLAWPWIALRIGGRQAGLRSSTLMLAPAVAALSTAVLLFLLLAFTHGEFDVPRREIPRLVIILGYSSCAAAVGSCISLLASATAGLPRGLRFVAMLLLCGGYFFCTLGIALVPFGQSSDGWWVDPNPIVGWVPLAMGMGAPMVLEQWGRSRLRQEPEPRP